MSRSKFGTSVAKTFDTNQGTNGSTYLDFIQSRRGVRGPVGGQNETLFDTADEKMMRIKDIIWQVADTNVPVLVTGDAGVGKSTIARCVVKAANKPEAPSVIVDCATASADFEAELFGAEKTSFSEQRIGRLEQAHNGTIILENITELSLPLQTKVLRLLQEKEIERVGGKAAIQLNTRIIATSNKNILANVAKGSFRKDLYYRLYVIHLEIPSLKERLKDVELLSNNFLAKTAQEYGKPGLQFAPDAMEKLLSYEWPGNVSELKNIVERSAIMCSSDVVSAASIPFGEEKIEESLEWIKALPIGQTMRTVETHFILETLKDHNGNRTHAAKTLGISLRTLRNKINEFVAHGYEVIAPQNGRSSS